MTEIWSTKESVQYQNFENFNLSSYYVRNKFIHGGVGIWSHKDLTIKPISLNQFCSDKDIEVCCVSYTNPAKGKFLIVNCYRSPSGNLQVFCDNIEKILNLLWKPDSNIILVGDFNLDPNRDSKQYTPLNNILSTYNLKNIINKPTREKYTLDHIYVNKVYDFLTLNYN